MCICVYVCVCLCVCLLCVCFECVCVCVCVLYSNVLLELLGTCEPMAAVGCEYYYHSILYKRNRGPISSGIHCQTCNASNPSGKVYM